MNPPLKPFQSQALHYLSDPEIKHLICISATGSGKTRIIEEWIAKTQEATLLISPLIALNRQHQSRFDALGFSRRVRILTPEKLSTIRETERHHLVVDECHTVFEWGESFRPSIRILPKQGSTYRKSLWLTATLPFPELIMLKEELGTQTQVMGEFSLPQGLQSKAFHIEGYRKFDFLRTILAHHDSPGLIFSFTRDGTERLARWLNLNGVSSVFYHAGMSREERRNLEDGILKNRWQCVVATVAFGMGMHIPALRWGICWNYPGSLLTVAQMMGRVGRSQDGGHFYYLWSKEDFMIFRSRFLPESRKYQEALDFEVQLSQRISLDHILSQHFQSNAFENRSNTLAHPDTHGSNA